MKTYIWIIIVLAILIGGFYTFNTYIYNQKQGNQVLATSPKDATYVIGGELVTLTNGKAETEIVPGAASKTITTYFGNEATADLDNDGREDTVFLLTQETGGSGTFYYVVAALNKETGYEGLQAFFLGDRIAPQTTEIHDGTIVVNYADRNAGEDFGVQPSLGMSLQLRLDTGSMALIPTSSQTNSAN